MNLLAEIHVTKKKLGLDDETYRAVLIRVAGKCSSRDMTDTQRRAVLAEFYRLGRSGPRPFVAHDDGGKCRKNRLDGRFAKKLQALWIAGWNLGLVEDRADTALIAFAKRQTGIDHVRFLVSATDAAKVIEALKCWLARDGGVEWTQTHGRKWLVSDPARICWAQYRKILPGATLMGNQRMFGQEVTAALGLPDVDLPALTWLQWQAVANDFGKRIRKEGKVGRRSPCSLKAKAGC